MAIQKGTTIYALYHPAQGNNIPSYFVDGKTLAAAGWDHKKLHDLVQVQSTLTDPNGRPPRTLVRQYTVINTICVASGRALRNGQFGSGGGRQMFISEADKINLMQGSNIGLK